MSLLDRFRRGSAGGKSAALRIYYTGDIHGSELCFQKFLRAPAFYKADVAIIGGDITGKALLPIVDQGDGHFAARLQGADRVVGEAELPELEDHVRFNGFYPYRCDRAEFHLLGTDLAHRTSVFSGLMVAQIRRWCAMAAERSDDRTDALFIMPGNDDEFAIDAAIGGPAVVNPDARVVRIGDYQMMSSAWASTTPWNSPREESEAALAARLDTIAADLETDIPVIMNLHCPPFDSGLDLAPKLTPDFRPVSAGGQTVLEPVGSRAVRTLIERLSPVLSLHGHIHESRGIAKIGRTTCVNPGSQYSEGRLDGALIDLVDGKVSSCQLVSG
jgi:Icc-related predicted phosphoesterase